MFFHVNLVFNSDVYPFANVTEVVIPSPISPERERESLSSRREFRGDRKFQGIGWRRTTKHRDTI